MAWPIIDWDAIHTTDMAVGISALWLSMIQRRGAFQPLSLAQETDPNQTFQWVPGLQHIKKEDGSSVIFPTSADGVMPFNKPLQTGGGFINFNLYSINNYSSDVWHVNDITVLSDTMQRFPSSSRQYQYVFTDSLGGTEWTGSSITSALSLDSDFFDLKTNDNTSIFDAKLWQDQKDFINAMVYVNQYQINSGVSTFIQSVDLRPFLTDQT